MKYAKHTLVLLGCLAAFNCCTSIGSQKVCVVQPTTVPPTPTTTQAPAVTPTPTPFGPPSTETVPPTSSPMTAPSLTPTPPSGPTLVPVEGNCSGPHSDPQDPSVKPVYADAVRQAQGLYQAANPGKFVQVGNKWKLPVPADWLPYALGVASNLRAMGYDAVVDICNCGQIAVAKQGDTTFSEDYAVLVSDGTVRDPINLGGFMDRCTPRAFPVVAPVSTATPTIRSVPVMATCPPLDFVSCGQKGGNSKFKANDGSGDTCILLDCTPKFVGVGPCNVEHNNCGDAGNIFPFAGDACEPAPGSFYADITAHRSEPAGYNEGKLCGPAGFTWSIVTSIQAAAKDKAGRPMALQLFHPKTNSGGL